MRRNTFVEDESASRECRLVLVFTCSQYDDASFPVGLIDVPSICKQSVQAPTESDFVVSHETSKELIVDSQTAMAVVPGARRKKHLGGETSVSSGVIECTCEQQSGEVPSAGE